MSNAFVEAVKELLRLVLMAIVSFLLTDLVISGAVEHFAGTRLDPWSKAQITTLVTTVLRTVDKYLHEYGKETNNPKLTKGLTFGL